MLAPLSPFAELRRALSNGTATPRSVAMETIRLADANQSKNTYLWRDDAALMQRAAELEARYPGSALRPPLWGVPISLKDCFDLAGTPTSCGSRFYAALPPLPAEHSTVARRLLQAGAMLPGKTHLHMLAYGITGQNPEYGDCLQPRDPALLTGGSSSGAAASVQEGSALAAIGTDTGGSIRVPAALCGLVGYRCSQSMTTKIGPLPNAWQGAAHLAPSFDTLGLLMRDPRDAAPLASALFRIAAEEGEPRDSWKIGWIAESFAVDAEPQVLAAYQAWRETLAAATHNHGPRLVTLLEISPSGWEDTLEIFAPLQASEAAQIHAGHFDQFEATIADRLRWGASLSAATLDPLRERLARFRAGMARLLEQFDLLMLPCAPVSRLPAASDLSAARQRILRYTTPFSLAGLPALSLPAELLGAPLGTGVQIAAAPGRDASLLRFASGLGAWLASQGSDSPNSSHTPPDPAL